MTNEEKHEHWLAYLDMIATQAVMRVAATYERTDPTLADMRIKRAVAELLAEIGPRVAEPLAPGLTEYSSAEPEKLSGVERALSLVEPARTNAADDRIPQFMLGDPQAQGGHVIMPVSEEAADEAARVTAEIDQQLEKVAA